MSRPLPELRLSTPISLAIAVVFGSVGLLLWRFALRTAAQSSGGYDGFGWLLLLLLAGGALAVAGLALYFARNRAVYWVGVVAIVVLFSL